jgi:hypothetical protein
MRSSLARSARKLDGGRSLRASTRDLGVHSCTVGWWLRGIGTPQVDDLYRLLSIARKRYEALLTAQPLGLLAGGVVGYSSIPNSEGSVYCVLRCASGTRPLCP